MAAQSGLTNRTSVNYFVDSNTTGKWSYNKSLYDKLYIANKWVFSKLNCLQNYSSMS